jgi:hypothetical protein
MMRVAEPVAFVSTTGPRLAGIIDVPQGEVRGWGVFAHGFTLGKDCPAASRICKQLASEGIGMLRFDNLGLGGSGKNQAARAARIISAWADPYL